MNNGEDTRGPVEAQIKVGAVYRHYKNKQKYEVLGVALHTETNERLVVYKPLYESEYQYFARPYDMFFGSVEHEGMVVKRFQVVAV